MKIKFDVDVTPEELRRFFGLPDVEPLNREMLEQVRRNMAAGMEGFDPATLLKPWLPAHLQSLDAMRKSFWDTFADGNKSARETDEHDEFKRE